MSKDIIFRWLTSAWRITSRARRTSSPIVKSDFDHISVDLSLYIFSDCKQMFKQCPYAAVPSLHLHVAHILCMLILLGG